MSFSSFLTNTKENTILKTPFYSNLKGSQQYSNEKSLSTQRNKNNYEENLHKKRIISKSPLDLFFPKIAQTKRVGYFERQENINNKTFNQKNNQDVVQYKITKPRKKMFCNLISFYTKKFKFNTPIPNNKLKILKPIFHRPSRSIFVLEKLKKDLKSLSILIFLRFFFFLN